MPFDPKCNKFPYTELTDRHYLHVKKDDGTIFDTNYPYIDESKKFKRKCFFFGLLNHYFVYPLAFIRLNLRIKGKKNLKKYKDVIKGGAVSICNHVHMWDYILVKNVMWKFNPKVLVWEKNISGENGKMIRKVGGVPYPENNISAVNKCFSEIENYINKGGLFHVYPEGSMWEFYMPIRPYKRGAFYFSVKCNKPIIPLGISYRENGFIRKKIFKSPASLTFNIGEPIYPNLKLGEKEAMRDLMERSHNAMCKLVGIDPKDNIYDSIYKNSHRIDYYTDTYGVGYKKSW